MRLASPSRSAELTIKLGVAPLGLHGQAPEWLTVTVAGVEVCALALHRPTLSGWSRHHVSANVQGAPTTAHHLESQAKASPARA